MTTGPGASPGAMVHVLRTRAASYSVYADALAVGDPNAAAVLREEAVQLRCRAAVIETLSALFDEWGLKAQMWAEFGDKLRGVS